MGGSTIFDYTTASPAQPTKFAPAVKPPPDLSSDDIISANWTLGRQDFAGAPQQALLDHYGPVVTALKKREPQPFLDTLLKGDRHISDARTGVPIKEHIVWADVQRIRKTDPSFLADIAATDAASFRKWSHEQEALLRKRSQGVVARQTGFSQHALGLGTGLLTGFADPINLAGMVLTGGGGAARSLVQSVAREAMINAAIEVVELPSIKANREGFGEEFGAADMAIDVGMAAGIGGLFGGAVHVGGRAIDKWRAKSDAKLAADFEAMVPQAQRTPAEQDALNVVQRSAEIAESSPFLDNPAGHEAHDAAIQRAIAEVEAQLSLDGYDRPTPLPVPAVRPRAPADYHAAIETQESGGRQIGADGAPLTSSAGAVGVMQVMPTTGKFAAKLAGVDWDLGRLRTDEAYNRTLGQAYFDHLLEQFDGDAVKAAAAYNAGPGSAASGRGVRGAMARAARDGGNWIEKLPAETRDYVAKFIARTGAEPHGGGATMLDPALFADETAWKAAQDAFDVERGVALPDRTEGAEIADTAVLTATAAPDVPAFDPAPFRAAAYAYVKETRKPLTPEALAKHLGLAPSQANAVLGSIAADQNAPIYLTKGRRVRDGRDPETGKRLYRDIPGGRVLRKPTGSGPEDVLAFVGRHGGLNIDSSHNLGRRRQAQSKADADSQLPDDRGGSGRGRTRSGSDWGTVLVPGSGPLARKGGMDVDAMGELLSEAGYFGANADRATEADVLELIDNAVRGRGEGRRFYRAEDQFEADAVMAARIADDEMAMLRSEYHEAFDAAGLARLDDSEIGPIEAFARAHRIKDPLDAAEQWATRQYYDGEIEYRSTIEDDFDIPFSKEEYEAYVADRSQFEDGGVDRRRRADAPRNPGEGGAGGRDFDSDRGIAGETGTRSGLADTGPIETDPARISATASLFDDADSPAAQLQRDSLEHDLAIEAGGGPMAAELADLDADLQAVDAARACMTPPNGGGA